MVQGERRISYARVRALRLGRGARARRATTASRTGDRARVLSPQLPRLDHRALRRDSAGGIGVGLNGWWATEEIAYGLEDSGSRFLVVDERLYPRVEPLLGRIAGLEKVFFIGAQPPPGTVPIAELLEPCDAPPTQPIDEDDPFVILYTSGTTGRSKGCITTHRGTIAQVHGHPVRERRRARCSGRQAAARRPSGGAAGVAADLAALPRRRAPLGRLHADHASARRSSSAQGRFDAEQVMQLIERERVTIWGAIPTMLHRVVHHPKVRDYDLSSLRGISFGGAPTPPETIEKAREVLPIEPTFANAYGLTETHGVATVNGGKDLLGRKTSIGRPLPMLEHEDRRRRRQGAAATASSASC